MKVSLRAARVNRGLTQKELAEKVDVTKKTVCSWESGKTYPKASKIQAICEALGVKYDDISWLA